MNSTDWQKIKKIYNEALDLPAEQRAGFVARAEETLRSEVEKLLRNEEKAVDFIPESAFVDIGLIEEDEADFYVGKRINDYLILNEIGRGGMGTIYLAVRADETFEKKVAIKLIKRGMDTTAVLKRFVLERRILASLEHPNIAALLDGGSTDDGLPYFVMEHIVGRPITEYFKEHGLDIKARLELFRSVCAAISYAHQNLVVHRDIKPSNILVTEDGTPKLLDFGIAKLLNPDWSPDSTDVTATAFRSMTPEYASPEQLQGRSISTASDIYSLGVVLYELLCGERPFKNESRFSDEFVKQILKDEPVKPSAISELNSRHSDSAPREETRNSSVQKTDGSRRHLNSTLPTPKALRGDLDNIVLKALQREPERRYQTIQEFSEDIRRHLEGLPVSAMADTTFYRVNKFFQRHRGGVLAAGFMLVSVLAGSSVAVWQAVEARTQRVKAERRFDDVRRLTNSFLFEFETQIRDLQGATPAREMTVRTALQYLDILAQENSDNSSLKFELASAYSKIADIQGAPGRSNLGDTAGAISSYQKSIAMFEALVQREPENGSFQRELAATHKSVAYVYEVTGHPDLVLKNNESAILIYQQLIVSDDDPILRLQFAECLKSLGDTVASRGDLEKALEHYRQMLEIGEAVLLSNPTERQAKIMIMTALDAIGTTLGNPNFTNLGDTDGALRAHQRQLDLVVGLLNEKQDSQFLRATKAHTLKVIGEVQTARLEWSDATSSFRSALEIQEDLVKSDEKDAFAKTRLAFLLTSLGEALSNSGKFDEALKNHDRSIAIISKLAENDTENGFLVQYLNRGLQKKADTLVRFGRTIEALDLYEKALKSDESNAAEDPQNMDNRPQLVNGYLQLARVQVILAKRSRPPEKERLNVARRNFVQAREVLLDMQRHNLRTKPIEDLLIKISGEIDELER